MEYLGLIFYFALEVWFSIDEKIFNVFSNYKFMRANGSTGAWSVCTQGAKFAGFM